MEMADYWLDEKQLVHKLFKVLVPRYENYSSSYTRLLLAPNTYPDRDSGKAVLELKGLILVCYCIIDDNI
jgi:large subunit ribosomal protein L17